MAERERERGYRDIASLRCAAGGEQDTRQIDLGDQALRRDRRSGDSTPL